VIARVGLERGTEPLSADLRRLHFNVSRRFLDKIDARVSAIAAVGGDPRGRGGQRRTRRATQRWRVYERSWRSCRAEVERL
jgi:hypothetical protein